MSKPSLECLKVLATLVFVVVASGCQSTPEPTGPSVIVVTFDTLRVDWTSPYNDQIDFTPALESMAQTGTVFENVYTRVPITLPSHSSLMSGRSPMDLGVLLNGDHLGDEVETLAERFKESGYQTAAFPSLGVLSRQFNLSQGFDTYDAEFGASTRRWYRTADEVVDAAKQWLGGASDRPFFLWAHLSDPHEPYLPKDAPDDAAFLLDGETVASFNLRSKEVHRVTLTVPPGEHQLRLVSLREPRDDDSKGTGLVAKLGEMESLEPLVLTSSQPLDGDLWLPKPVEIALSNEKSKSVEVNFRIDGRINSPPPSEVFEYYRYEVAFADRYFGELRQAVAEKTDNAVWIVSSDHGEGLFHHGTIGHAATAHEDQMRVLWLMDGPGIPAGQRVKAPMLNEDIAPTLLSHLGWPDLDGSQGESRVDCFEDSECEGRNEWWSYGASVDRQIVTAIAAYRWPFKLLWHKNGRSGAFHLLEDPYEESNLAGGRGRKYDTRLHELDDLNSRFDEQTWMFSRLIEQRRSLERDSELEAMLDSLGYIGGN